MFGLQTLAVDSWIKEWRVDNVRQPTQQYFNMWRFWNRRCDWIGILLVESIEERKTWWVTRFRCSGICRSRPIFWGSLHRTRTQVPNGTCHKDPPQRFAIQLALRNLWRWMHFKLETNRKLQPSTCTSIVGLHIQRHLLHAFHSYNIQARF